VIKITDNPTVFVAFFRADLSCNEVRLASAVYT